MSHLRMEEPDDPTDYPCICGHDFDEHECGVGPICCLVGSCTCVDFDNDKLIEA